MQVTIEGRVKKLSGVETAKSGKFSKRTVWVDIDQDTKYPQTVSVEFAQKSMERLNLVDEGDNVLIEADLRGREWEGRVYNSLHGWKCVIESPKSISKVSEQVAMDDSDDDFDENEDEHISF